MAAFRAVRFHLSLIVTAIALCVPVSGFAGQTDERLTELFRALGETDDELEARELQLQIADIWREPDSATIELLLNRGLNAINEQDYDTARVHLNDIVDLAPNFAEGWNQRAMLNFITNRYDEAILDIQKTVSLEPRHYGAWSGLGQIFEAVGNERAALEAYRRALNVNPHLEGAEQAIRRLAVDVEGQGI